MTLPRNILRADASVCLPLTVSAADDAMACATTAIAVPSVDNRRG